MIRYFYTIAHSTQMHWATDAGLLACALPVMFLNVGAVDVHIEMVVTHGPPAPSVQTLHTLSDEKEEGHRRSGRCPPC